MDQVTDNENENRRGRQIHLVHRADLRRPPLIAYSSLARWLLVGVLAASVWFFHDFLVPVLAATIIAFATWPLRVRLHERAGLGRTLTGALLVLLIVLFLVIPIIIALGYAAREFREWLSWAIQINAVGGPPPDWLNTFPVIGSWLVEQWSQHIGRPGAIGELVQVTSGANIGTIYRGVLTASSMALHLALALIFMLITLFVLYRDGDRVAAQLDMMGSGSFPADGNGFRGSSRAPFPPP